MNKVTEALEGSELVFDKRWGWMWPQFADFSKGFIYLIRCEGFIKIGVSEDVDSRLGTISVCNPYPVTLDHVFALPSAKDAFHVERNIHNALSRYHHKGEWFTPCGMF